MINVRSTVVVWAVTGLSALVIVCATVLIALDRISGTEFGILVTSFLAPVVMILLSAQVSTLAKKVDTVDAKVDTVNQNVNGHMTSLIAKIPEAEGGPAHE